MSKSSGARSASRPAPRTHDPVARRIGQAVGRAFDGHGHGTRGLFLIGLGILAGLSVYADLAGPVGEALDLAIGSVVGLVKVLVPPTLIGLGALIIRGPREDSEFE